MSENTIQSSSFAKRLRQEWEWERERGGGGYGVTRDKLENELAGGSTLNLRHRCADSTSSWRLVSTRTHSLPRTLEFRGYDSMWTFQPVRFRTRFSWSNSTPPPPPLSHSHSWQSRLANDEFFLVLTHNKHGPKISERVRLTVPNWVK